MNRRARTLKTTQLIQRLSAYLLWGVLGLYLLPQLTQAEPEVESPERRAYTFPDSPGTVKGTRYRVIEGRTDIIVHAGKTTGIIHGSLNGGDEVTVIDFAEDENYLLIICPNNIDEICTVAQQNPKNPSRKYLEPVEEFNEIYVPAPQRRGKLEEGEVPPVPGERPDPDEAKRRREEARREAEESGVLVLDDSDEGRLTLKEMFANPPMAMEDPMLVALPGRDGILVRRVPKDYRGHTDIGEFETLRVYRMGEGRILSFKRMLNAFYAIVACPAPEPLGSECVVAIRNPDKPEEYWMELKALKTPNTPTALRGKGLEVLPRAKEIGGIPVRIGAFTDSGRDLESMRLEPGTEIKLLRYSSRPGWVEIECPETAKREPKEPCYIPVADPNDPEKLLVTLAGSGPKASYDDGPMREEVMSYADKVLRRLEELNFEDYQKRACLARILFETKLRDRNRILAAIEDEDIRRLCEDGLQTMANPDGQAKQPGPYRPEEVPEIDSCVNGKMGNDYFHRQLFSTDSDEIDIGPNSFLKRWRELRHLKREMQSWLDSCGGQYDLGEKLAKQIENMPNEAVTGRIPRLKSECVEAAMQRSFPTEGYLCTNNSRDSATAVNGPGNNGPCATEELADYLTYMFNTVVACVSPKKEPLDPRILLKKINGETAFAFWSENDGGVGIGQLVQIGLDEVRSKGNGGYVVNEVLNGVNSNPECNALRPLLQSIDPVSQRNQVDCEVLNLSEGVARSLFYSTALYLHNRDFKGYSFGARRQVERRKSAEEGLPFREILALVAYGPDGPSGIKDHKPNGSDTIEEYFERTRRTNTYVRNYVKKWEETMMFLCCDNKIEGVCNRNDLSAEKMASYCRSGKPNSHGIKFTPEAISGELCIER